jgi:hypothetical protein
VFGSIFASAYAPKIVSAFRPLPIPAGPKAESHQSVAAAVAVIHHAPQTIRPALETIVFNAFHSGLFVACVAGAGVAVLGAAAAFKLLPGREVEVEVEGEVAVAGAVSAPAGAPARAEESGAGEPCQGEVLAPV